MAKRFTESEKWKDPWFSELSNDWKIVWLYLLDNCDHSGVFQLNMRRLNFDCNTSITLIELLDNFKDRVIKLSDEKLFITKFMYYQYGTKFWNSKQPTVVSAIKILDSHNLLGTDDKGLPTLIIPYNNTSQRVMEMEMEMDMSLDTEKDMDSDMNLNPEVDTEMSWEELMKNKLK